MFDQYVKDGYKQLITLKCPPGMKKDDLKKEGKNSIISAIITFFYHIGKIIICQGLEMLAFQ